MATLDELLATLQEDDPEAAKALQETLTAAATEKEQLAKQLAKKDRDYKLATDKKYRERFPRAMMKFDRGKLALPEDIDDEGLISALGAEEEELAELGVPIPTGAAPAPEKPKADAVKPDTEPTQDPAKSWGEPVGGSPHTPDNDPVKDYWEGLRGTTTVDRRKSFDALVALNRQGEQRPEGKIWELARAMEEDEFNKPIEQKIW